MRDIKFRAWDKKKNIMRRFCEKGFQYLMSSFEPCASGDGLYYVESGDSAGEDFILMQFTGLKDKNGKDIYEGDIVKMHQFLFEGVEIEKEIGGVIGWNEYGLTLKQIRNEYIQEYCGYKLGEGEVNLNDIYGLHEESWDVIGTIHEHPELLKENK